MGGRPCSARHGSGLPVVHVPQWKVLASEAEAVGPAWSEEDVDEAPAADDPPGDAAPPTKAAKTAGAPKAGPGTPPPAAEARRGGASMQAGLAEL